MERTPPSLAPIQIVWTARSNDLAPFWNAGHFYRLSKNTGHSCQLVLPIGKIPLNAWDFLLPTHGVILRNVVAMNKAELIEAIQAALGKDATKRAADEALEAVLSSIAKGVKKDKKVQIIGFGTFEVKKRAARQGRNPKTGEAMKIAASKSVGFKPSSVLKGSL
jgi:DNA-binding protein HU-beta